MSDCGDTVHDPVMAEGQTGQASIQAAEGASILDPGSRLGGTQGNRICTVSIRVSV